MELLLIRHLPTKWNQNEVLQGLRDIPILPVCNEVKHDIQTKRKAIEDFSPEIILVSQLVRTKQTAFAYGYNKPKIEPLLNELNFGMYEGKEKKELLKVSDWIHNPRALILGERMIDFEERLVRFINYYKEYSRVLVFGHGSWIRGMLSISRIGTIQEMNKMTVKNNEMINLQLSGDIIKC
ncbi:histidine phosphatase family protein [Calidifontibacillus oryziterrae]|uniref:histidine phosphatase family protein n=1 Tax=Calidifontibacillus oryziterrae TaxID=1191699 RepID=UPI0003024A9D|nr:phosphoglycerate mutase family protein [Calidifontibacillus oryziterrae]